MLKIQKLQDGEWQDFVTVHSRGFGQSNRTVTDTPTNPIAAMFGQESPVEVISLLERIREGYSAFNRRHDDLPDDRTGAVMEDIEFGRLDRLSESERKFMIGLAMLGFDAAMLIAQAIE